MSIAIKGAADLQQLLDTLAAEFWDAHKHFRMFRNLAGAFDLYGKEVSQSPTFWNLTIEAHRDLAVFRLCRIFDQKSDTLSLLSLIQTIGDNLALFQTDALRERLAGNPHIESLCEDNVLPTAEELSEHIAFASEQNPDVKNLRMWRHNYFAHRGAKVLLKGMALDELYPLPFDTLELLIRQGSEIVSHYGLKFSCAGYSNMVMSEHDYQYPLDCVREHLAEQEKKIAAELKAWQESTAAAATE